MRILIPAILLCAAVLPVEAQVMAAPDELVLLVAKSVQGECGWKCSERPELAAIVHIYLKRVDYDLRRLSWMVQTYSRPMRRCRRMARDRALVQNAWICGLRLDGRRPEHLRAGLRWRQPMDADGNTRQAAWLANVEGVREVFRGERPDPCPEALHFGSVEDGPPGPRSVPACPELAERGDVRNRLWTVPEERDRIGA